MKSNNGLLIRSIYLALYGSALGMALAPIEPAKATAYTWKDAVSSGNWTAAGNWNPSGSPGSAPGDTAAILRAASTAVTVNSGIANTLDSLTVVSANAGSVNTLTLNAAASKLNSLSTVIGSTNAGANNGILSVSQGKFDNDTAANYTIEVRGAGGAADGRLNVSGGAVGSATTAIVNNGGAINVSGGTVSAGSLSASVNGLVSITKSTASVTTGVLDLTGGGKVNIVAGGSLKVSGDYNNNFGVGNAFNAHTNVNATGGGTGTIDSTGSATAQSLGGAVTNGSKVDGDASVPTMTFGNVHVGQATSQDYQIDNAAGGPTLRGAIQVAGLDGRLSGTGVTAGNWVANAGSGVNETVTLKVDVAGVYTPLSQDIHLVNNFDNVKDQTLRIESQSGAAAYAYAQASTLNGSVSLGKFHTGDAGANQTLTLGNVAADTGGFTEKLAATVVSSDAGVQGMGTTGSIAAGGSGSVTVGIDTAAAGAKSGDVKFQTVSDGAGTSNLGNTNLNQQTVAVSGAVYDYAQTSTLQSSVNFGNVHKGDAATQNLSLANTAADTGGYTEKLAATTTDAHSMGTTSLIAAGASGTVSVGLDTSSVGDKTGATVAFEMHSDGTGTSDLGANTKSLGTQNVSLSGKVYDYAQTSQLVSKVDLGGVHRNDPSANQNLILSNTAADTGGFTEKLGSRVVSISTLQVQGSASGLIDANSSGTVNVALNTNSSGLKQGIVTLEMRSDGTGTSGLAATALGQQAVEVTGKVYDYAAADLFDAGGGYAGATFTGSGGDYTVDFHNLADDSGIYTFNLKIGNIGGLDADFTDLLGGVFDLSQKGAFGAGGFISFSAIRAGDFFAGLSVTVNTNALAAQAYTGDITLNPTWNNANLNGATSGALDDIVLHLAAKITPSGGNPVPEPGALWLLGAGLWSMGFRKRGRRRAS
jgi:hypothetical protein